MTGTGDSWAEHVSGKGSSGAPEVTWVARAEASIIGAAMQKSLHFLYHELRQTSADYTYVTPLKEFEAHCALFAELRSATDDVARLVPEITFDDGHASDAEFAMPVLRRHDLRATFFITAGWTGTKPGFMDWGALRSLRDEGHRLGAHGLTHTLLTACTPAQLHEELATARNLLEEHLEVPIVAMSLPGGRANARVFRACFAAGFQQVFTSLPRAEPMAATPQTVGRLNLTGGTSPGWLLRVLDTRSGLLARMERAGKVKAGAQRVLGDNLYARLWALGNRQKGAEMAPSAQTSGSDQGNAS